MGLLLIAAAIARPAHAFGLEAIEAVATRLGHELPALGWTPSQDAVLASEVERRLDAEAADPETFAALHRFDPEAADGTPATEAVGGPTGALAEFNDAVVAMRRAFASPDPAAPIAPLVRLAAAACDLADPFLTSNSADDEAPGARASFSDLFEPMGFDTLPAIEPETADLLAAATALANDSASMRAEVEQAVLDGDLATVARIRAERLERALGLARRAAREAQSLSVADLPADSRPGTLALWPNPAPGPVRLGFALARSGPVRLELIDVGGRRVRDRAIGTRAAGSQSVTLDAGVLSGLPAGTYFVRLTAGESEWNGRLVRIAP